MALMKKLALGQDGWLSPSARGSFTMRLSVELRPGNCKPRTLQRKQNSGNDAMALALRY